MIPIDPRWASYTTRCLLSPIEPLLEFGLDDDDIPAPSPSSGAVVAPSPSPTVADPAVMDTIAEWSQTEMTRDAKRRRKDATREYMKKLEDDVVSQVLGRLKTMDATTITESKVRDMWRYVMEMCAVQMEGSEAENVAYITGLVAGMLGTGRRA